jgi:hypothetical protein
VNPSFTSSIRRTPSRSAGRLWPYSGAARESLARIAREYSPDLATLLLAEELLDDERSARMQARYLEELADLDAGRPLSTDIRETPYTILFVPGWLYRSHPVNYVPLPLSGDVTERARSGYESMRQLGPNDGLALTTDEILPGGITILEAGLDHFMKAPDIDRRTAALVRLVVRKLGER